MLLPKKTKYRKQQKGRRRKKGIATSRTNINFGEFGLRALETHWITSSQIESVRRTITHSLKRKGKLWIRIFPDKPVTAKAGETPMGKGKGTVDYWVAPIKRGTIMFEVTGVSEGSAIEAFRLAGHKLPIKTQFVKK